MQAERAREEEPLGRLVGFGVAFGSQRVLRDITVDFPSRGVLLLLGPAGEGKSTLLRTLAGLNDAQPSLRTWGELHFSSGRPTLVRQNARLLLSSLHENLVSGLPNRSGLTRGEQAQVLEAHLSALDLHGLIDRLGDDVSSLPRSQQRLASIARALLSEPRCLLLDEPTAGLLDDEAGAEQIVKLILSESQRRLVVTTTHNQRHAQMMGGEVILLVDGSIQQRTNTRAFFEDRDTPAAQSFVRSGRCLAPEGERPTRPPPAPRPQHPVSRSVGPQGFYWLLQGQLGGAPRPGITSELRWDLEALARLGTTVLVSLEEQLAYDSSQLGAYGMSSEELRIDDMDAPALEQASAFCAHVERSLETGEIVVLHCRAGLGRTGTMLAAQLIWRGVPPAEAVEQARAVNPKWIQSQTQIDFLSRFFRHIRGDIAPESNKTYQENEQ